MTEHTRVIEIQGQKFEVDMRQMKKIEHYKIGDRVKVLRREYEGWKVYPGVVVAFDDFNSLPTATICYVACSYWTAELKFEYLNAQTEELEIAPCDDDFLPVERADVIDKLEREISKRRAEIDDLQMRIYYFNKQFGRYFGDVKAVEAEQAEG